MKFGSRARHSRSFVTGAILFGCIVLVAVLAPVIAPHSPTTQDLSAGLLPPSLDHLFGTDQLGRDVFSRVLYAARVDLGIAFAAAVAPFVIGLTLGLVSGYFGRAPDWVISRVTDTVIAFPFYVLVIAIVFALGAGATGIIVTFAIVGWVGYARVTRSLTASMREQGWVRAARGGGLSHARVMLRHILPNVLPQAIVLLATEIVLIMVAIVTLGYLGLGIRPPTPDWGTMIADGQAFVTSHWWLSALPGVAVVVTGIALSLLGDGVGDALRVAEAPRSTRLSRRQRARLGRSAAVQEARHTLTQTSDLAVDRPAPGSLRVRGLVLDAVVPRETAAGVDRPLVGGGASSDTGIGGGSADDRPGLDFDVAPGAALGIVGESGSGKSLTLRAIVGLLPQGVRQVSGQIDVGGTVGMVFQDPLTALDPLTRVGTQLREACVAGGAQEPEARVRELLAAVQLPASPRIARSYPHELSGGQLQRVVIAMALAGNPSVLLADEPTTALDVTVQREVLELLASLRRERGLTLVFVSHDLAVVAAVCEQIVVMRHGEIVEAGDTRTVLARPEHPYTRMLIDSVPEMPAPQVSVTEVPVHEKPVAGGADHATPDITDLRGSNASPVLRLRGVSIHRGNRETVRDVTFAVRGSLGLVGESGSGKTTIARAIAGELPIAAGTIEFEGQLLVGGGESRARQLRRPRELRTAMQLIPQDPAASLNPRMTAGQTLAELLRAHGRLPGTEVATRVTELLTQVGLESSIAAAYPHELSGGQRQRVAIARALAVSPRLLIADEATSALDVSVQAEVMALLRRLREELGLALLVISHDLAVVHELCDKVVVLRDGEIIEQGTHVLVDPREPYSRELVAAVPRLPR